MTKNRNLFYLPKIIISILLGFFISWLVKGNLTPILFYGKSFIGRNPFYKFGIIFGFTLFFSIVCFFIISLFELIFHKQTRTILRKSFDWLKQLKSSIFHEVGSHLQLLAITKKDVTTYFFSPYRIVLIVLFILLFLPHVFVMVNDIGLISAYEVDPGSIINSISSLFQHPYNMNMGYHSQYYGWTYFSINFFLLLPIYLAKLLKIVIDDYFFFVAIRFIFFIIGLACVLAFFEVAKRTLKNSLLSFIGTLLFIGSPIIFRFFYFLHPETTGLFFLFIGILCLLRFNDGLATDKRFYTFGLLALVLSVLSKQVFIFTAVPVLFLFVYFYCHHQRKSTFRFLISKQFLRIFLGTALFAVLVFFIIDPFAFFQPKVFIENQIILFSAHTQGSLTQSEAIGKWIEIIKAFPVIFISIILFPLTVLGAIFLIRNQKVGKILYLVNIVTSLLFVAFISLTSRYIIYDIYFAPIYPFLILNLLSIPLFIINKSEVRIIKWATTILLTYFLFFILLGSFSVSIPMGYTRLMYKDSIAYQTYNYIENNIPNGSRIAYDQFVGIPSNKGIIACLYWQGCGTDYIEKFNPDYVIFSEDWTFNGQITPETMRLIKYVTDHHFLLIDTVKAYSNADISRSLITFGVWKRPLP